MRRKLQVWAVLLVIVTGVVGVAVPAGAQPRSGESDRERLTRKLQGDSHGGARVSVHAGTGLVRFVGTDARGHIRRPDGVTSTASPEDAGRAFLRDYGKLLGVADQASELRLTRSRKMTDGRSSVRFQQVHRGVPVLGGDLVVNLDGARNVLSASGEVSPELDLGVKPALSPQEARRIARELVGKQRGLASERLPATSPELWVYDPALVGAPGPQHPATTWRVVVSADEPEAFREVVLVNAATAQVVLHYDELSHARVRRVCDRANAPGASESCTSPYTRSEGEPPTGIEDVDAAYDHAGDTYAFYKNKFGRDSMDNAGMELRSTVRYCPSSFDCPYTNAYWNGAQIVLGDRLLADDVVGHEWTHAVTQFTANLFYYYQSGAINESLSDVFGELIDLTNGTGDDSAPVRWLVGEDTAIGAIRDMENPGTFGDPDRVTSPNYWTSAGDGGGVHTNSGVNNKAASLLVDGGTFNGRTITKLGIDRTSRIYYEALTNLLTSASDYQDLFDALQQACANLIGTAAITTHSCAQVKKAVEATEMNVRPSNGPSDAPVCGAGEVPVDLFADHLEDPSSGNWTKTRAAGSMDWAYPQNPNAYPGFDATWASSGIYNFFGDDPPVIGDFSIERTTDVVLPGATTAYLRFAHAYKLETGFDGGVVEYSTNGGTTWVDGGALFTHNGYTRTLSTNYSNPLGGRAAFSGEARGYHSSRLDLTSLAGQSVRFRFRIGSDRSVAGYGWFIDDVRLYTCGAAPPNATGNKLANPSMESDANADGAPDGWTPVTTDVTRSATISHTGAYSMLHSASDDSSHNVQQTQSGVVTPGHPYAFTGWFLVDNSALDAFSFVVDVRWRDASGNVIGTVPVAQFDGSSPTGTWLRGSASMVAPPTASSVQVRLRVTSLNASVYVDDVFFGNLLPNGGFERDDDGDSLPDAWSQDRGSVRSPAVFHGGAFSMRHRPVDNQAYDIFYQAPGIIEGLTYGFTGWVNVPTTDDPVALAIELEWRSATNAVLRIDPIATYSVDTAGVWQEAAGVFVAPAGAVRARLRMAVGGLAPTAYVDDFVLSP